jgi:glutamyl-tRNA synthetase
VQLAADGSIAQVGEFGSYIQSERLHLYQEAVRDLLAADKAYYCYCSSERLDELRKEQTALKQPPMYDRHCRNLTDEQRVVALAACEAEGRKPVVRFAMPLEGSTTIHDLIYGDVTFEHKLIDDQVILKSDGFPTYHLAVVVDDHAMRISHVIRGEEWIPSTPKHLQLYAALGWEAPQFAHLPLIVNPDKTKLSKRQGDVSVEDFLQKGYLPETLVNFVAFLGWNPKTEQELFSMEQLIAEFGLDKVNKSGAVLDPVKLDWMNAQYIKPLSDADLVTKLLPYWAQGGVTPEQWPVPYLEAIVGLERERLKKLSDISSRTEYFFEDPEYDGQLLVWKKSDAATTKHILGELAQLFAGYVGEWSLVAVETAVKQYISDKGYDNGTVLWPLRVALTGLDKSPGPFEVASVLGAHQGASVVVRRLERAVSFLA